MSFCGKLVPWLCLLLAAAMQSHANRQHLSMPRPWCDGESKVRFATWNIQNFGESKATRPAVMRALAKVIARYDIVVIQELSQIPSGAGPCGDNTMSAICSLQEHVNKAATRRTFSLAVSPRIGDEQYALLYNPEVATLVDYGQYPDSKQQHSRPPYAFVVHVGSKTMAIASSHVKPSEAHQELNDYPAVMAWMEDFFHADYNLIAGDFNADGSYFDEDACWPPVLNRMPGYCMLTDNTLDTTVARSSNTYDRILASSSLVAAAPQVFVPEDSIDLAEVFEEGCSLGYVSYADCIEANGAKLMAELSDHYPVELCLDPESSRAHTSCPPLSSAPARRRRPCRAPRRRKPRRSGPQVPSSLKPGDCAVAGFRTDNPDDFAVVLLAPIGTGEMVFVTDDGVRATGSLRRGEGILSYTATQPVAAGAVLRLANFTESEEGRFALSGSGDQVIVFVGGIEKPEFVCALSNRGAWESDASSSITSALPTGLTDGVNALSFPNIDNGAYTGATRRGSPEDLRAAIHDLSNWASDNNKRRAPTMPSSFTVEAHY